MTNSIFKNEAIRNAIISSLPNNDDSNPEPRFTYVPPSHAKALNPEHTIVEGMRGAGKSHWWNALVSPGHRAYLEDAFPEAKISENIVISLGYGTQASRGAAQNWPSKDVLQGLITNEGLEARYIWKTILAICAELKLPKKVTTGKWKDKVTWVKNNPEDFDELLNKKDLELFKAGKTLLVIFDALDRLADDWSEIRPLAKALFQLSLDIRSTRSIRFKIFVRPDMLEDNAILAFPDSSKLVARKVTLNWQRADLYALFFQCLSNCPNVGSHFRSVCTSKFDIRWKPKVANGIWVLPSELRRDDDLQKLVFHSITGPAMAGGSHGHKRGFPYTWLPNHLIDGKDQVSPRSFSAALRNAAEFENPNNWPYALHFNGIKKGVQEASRIRVWEMTNEDYPWVADVMKPLAGVTVPCINSDIFALWDRNRVLENISSSSYSNNKIVKLLPPSLEEGRKGVLNDLVNLGIMAFIWDGRIQMPDVYRISFGLGRRGGVKPLK